MIPFSDLPSDSPECCHTELVMEDTHSVWVSSEWGEKGRLVLTGPARYLGLVLDPLSFLTGARSAIMESISSCLSGLFRSRRKNGLRFCLSAHSPVALKWVRFGFVYVCQRWMSWSSVCGLFHDHHHHHFYLLVFLTEDGSGYQRIPREFGGIFQVT